MGVLGLSLRAEIESGKKLHVCLNVGVFEIYVYLVGGCSSSSKC
jgi:hypothetical protein